MYATYIHKNIMPSVRLIFFFCRHAITKIIVLTNNIIVSVKIVVEIGAWDISPTEPNIRDILIILEPTTLPRAKSFSPFLYATTDVTNSGKLVPTAKIVSPTRASLIPICIAKYSAVVATHSPPKTTAPRPKIIYIIVCQIFKLFSSAGAEI